MSNGRKYPPRNAASGDCPVCNKYQSRSKIIWRGLAFCSQSHLRQYMWETMAEDTLEEHADLWEELVEK